MQIDVGASIADLLYEHETVSIPGLGSFMSSYKAAMVDQVEGKIHPPSRQLNFNKNLLLDDGLLLQHLRRKYNVSYATAMLAIEEYVNNAKATIEQRNILTIPGVGRLYKDYEQNFKFLPDDVNFNTDAYGLPTVQAYQVVRSAQEATPKVKATKPQASQASQATGGDTGKTFGKWMQRNLALVSGVFVIAIAFAVYFQFFYQPRSQEEVPSTRFNVSPSRMTSEESVESSKAPKIEKEDPANDDVKGTDTEGATLAPGQKYCIIAIGMFGDSNNVKRLVKKAYEAGYEPFTEPVGKNTRVGVQFAYKDEKEIQTALNDIHKKFGVNPVVMKK